MEVRLARVQRVQDELFPFSQNAEALQRRKGEHALVHLWDKGL